MHVKKNQILFITTKNVDKSNQPNKITLKSYSYLRAIFEKLLRYSVVTYSHIGRYYVTNLELGFKTKSNSHIRDCISF